MQFCELKVNILAPVGAFQAGESVGGLQGGIIAESGRGSSPALCRAISASENGPSLSTLQLNYGIQFDSTTAYLCVDLNRDVALAFDREKG